MYSLYYLCITVQKYTFITNVLHYTIYRVLDNDDDDDDLLYTHIIASAIFECVLSSRLRSIIHYLAWGIV